MTDWTYYDFYFGNANWPSGYLWRVDGDRRELQIEYGLYVGSVDEARRTYERWQERLPLAEATEPEYYEESDGRVGLHWWAHLPPGQEERDWDFSIRAGMGKPGVSKEYPYPSLKREYKPLYD